MRSGTTLLLLTCLVVGVFAISTLADSSNTLSDGWGLIRYTHWPTKVMYGRGHDYFAVTQTTLPNQQIKVDFLQDGWYAVFKPTERTRHQSTIIGYIPASDAYPLPLTNVYQIVADAIDSNLPLDHAELLQDAMRLATQRKYDMAVDAAGTALSFTRMTLGSKHPDVATCLVTLGHVYQLGKHYGLARQMYEQALEVNESVGTNSFLVMADLNNLALCHYHLKEYQEAEVLFDKSLAMSIEVVGEQSHAATQILQNKLALYRTTKRTEDATACEALIQRNMRQNTVIVGASQRPYIDFGIFGNRTPNAPISDGEIRALNYVAELFER